MDEMVAIAVGIANVVAVDLSLDDAELTGSAWWRLTLHVGWMGTATQQALSGEMMFMG